MYRSSLEGKEPSRSVMISCFKNDPESIVAFQFRWRNVFHIIEKLSLQILIFPDWYLNAEPLVAQKYFRFPPLSISPAPSK